MIALKLIVKNWISLIQFLLMKFSLLSIFVTIINNCVTYYLRLLLSSVSLLCQLDPILSPLILLSLFPFCHTLSLANRYQIIAPVFKDKCALPWQAGSVVWSIIWYTKKSCGFNLSQGTNLGCGFDPLMGHLRGSLSLSHSLPPFLSH